MAFIFELLERKRHNRASFKCGQDDLDRYLHAQATQDIKKRVATVFVLVDYPNSNVLAYYTLSAYSVELVELDNALAKSLPKYPLLPATLLGRLAVDVNYQGKGLGEVVLVDALKRSLAATVQVASLAVVVDALDQRAASFYQKYGFQQFKQHPLKLYLSMQSVAQLF
jgi:predicted GNAT family N-acyltransferase